VLRAAMQVALHYDTVLLVEATSNQVDQFGGYTGMTPPQFATTCTQLARSKASRWSGWCWAATTSARTPGRAGCRHRHAARRNPDRRLCRSGLPQDPPRLQHALRRRSAILATI
jgi:hypothetical protein